jgi:peptidoglycan/xylan/chitin deacetylase (PgdA/CDA1 family)
MLAGAAAIGVTLALSVLTAYRFLPGFDLLGRVRWRLAAARDRCRCALTFDDGPSPGTAAVLDLLRDTGVPATFFVLARNAERYPHLVRRAAAEGHAVGVHGLTHRVLSGSSEGDAAAEIGAAVDALARLGVPLAALYRAPKGRMPPPVLRAARRLGLQPWAWTRGVWDTSRPPAETLVRRATRWARDGMVLLLHDGLDDAASPDIAPMLAALPRIIATLRARGFDFVRLDDATTGWHGSRRLIRAIRAIIPCRGSRTAAAQRCHAARFSAEALTPERRAASSAALRSHSLINAAQPRRSPAPTMMPSSPGRISSRRLGMSEATTAHRMAIASSTTIEAPSLYDGSTTTSHSA